MNDTEYNGWKNYPTWLINLELLDDYCQSLADDGQSFDTIYELSDHLREYTESVIADSGDNAHGLVVGYAMAFIGQVDYDEIAKHHYEMITTTTEGN